MAPTPGRGEQERSSPGPGEGAGRRERGVAEESGEGRAAWRERGGAGAEAGAGEGRGGNLGIRLGQGWEGRGTYLSCGRAPAAAPYLLPLEHVVLRLLADGRDQVELPGHPEVGLL